MTDEESRKAYEAHFEAHGNDCWRNCSLAVWQASAEYHTKRERERCANWAWQAREIGQDALWVARRIEWVEQEPKP